MANTLELLNFVNSSSALQPPTFKAQQATGQSVPNLFTGLAVTWGSPIVDTYGGWSAGSPTRYTATTPGWYLLSGQIAYVPNSTGARVAQFELNGSTATAIGGCTIPSTTSSSYNLIVGCTGIVFLNGSTDFVELWGYQDSGGGLNTVASSTVMMATRIHI
jgi:hypothetical protein